MRAAWGMAAYLFTMQFVREKFCFGIYIGVSEKAKESP